MPAAQTRARLGHLTIKTPGRASIDDLRRSFMADQQHIGQTLDRLRIETSVKITFRQFREALLQRQLIATPAFEAAGNNRHFFNAEGAQHPPGARRGEEIAFIVYHQMLIAADAKFAHGDGKRLRARHHVRQRAGMVGEGFDIEKNGAGNMARLILSVKIALFLSRRSHTGVNNLDFRVINMFRQPVGSDKKRGRHRRLLFYCSRVNCRRFPGE